jgi:ADP-ribosylglycohydrolase
MIGAIAGDIIGSVFEWNNIKTTEFQLFSPESTFTDDTVLTVAVADVLLNGGDYVTAFKKHGQQYPDCGYGDKFIKWLFGEDTEPYNSWGNGSAMRVSPIGFAFDSVDEVIAEAEKSAAVTHNHPEGIKGAQAIALSILLARTGSSKENIRKEISKIFAYDLDRTLDEIRPTYTFDVSCRGSVPEAIIAFLESNDFEDAIRKAVSIGGDSDTLACITGGIAQAFYREIPSYILENTYSRLPDEMRAITDAFSHKFSVPY